MKEQIFQIFRSKKSFTEKPTITECKSLNYNRENLIREIKEGKREPFKVSLNQIKCYMEEGYSINASVTNTTQLLILDIDVGLTEIEFLTICKKWDIVPNIFYRTFSYTPEKEKFRAIYKLDKGYNQEQYKSIYEMMSFIFDNKLDKALSNFKQLVHGTNKKVALLHGLSLDPRTLAEKVKWKPEVKLEKKTYNFPTGRSSEFLTLEGVLEHFKINTTSFHYNEAMDIYLTLREFNLEDRLQLVSEDKREEYFKAFERAYKNGKKPERNSIGAKLFGALSKVFLREV